MRRSVVQGIVPLLATIAIVALLGCDEPLPPSGTTGQQGPPGEQGEQPQQPQDPPESYNRPGARVTISSTPSDAYITVNGDTGNARTPATLDLPPGTHDLTIHKPGVGTTTGSADVDVDTESNLHVTLDSTKADRFPTLRGSRGGSTWTFEVGSDQAITRLPLGQGGDPPLTMQVKDSPSGMEYEQVTYTDTSGYTGPSLVISWEPTREGTFTGSYQVVDSDGDTFSFPVSIEAVPYQPSACQIIFNSDPTICACTERNGVVTPQKCLPVPTVDGRCPYPVMMVEGGWAGSTVPAEPRRLLAQVSAKGTLCATANTVVSLAALDKVSRVSTTMLQHRHSLVEWTMTAKYQHRTPGGDVIVLYGESESWCSDFPSIYTDQYCGGAPTFASGIYARPIILCPEDDLAVCVHEIAHAVYYAMLYDWGPSRDESENELRQVKDRFAEPDIGELWNGYALTNEGEFFAEMSAIYFCVGSTATQPKLHCADELKRHDSKTYEVIHRIYRGSADLR